MANTIQEYVIERGITSLTHFTRLANLASILQRGLLIRDVLVAEGNTGQLNDQYRLDRTPAICLSIGFPNYKMFWSLRQSNAGTEWVVLAIAPAVLWELPCAFCVENAASAQVTAIPIQQRTGLPAFKAMYEDFGGKSRAQLGLPNSFPTHPQAEVLMMNGVPIRYILGVAVQDNNIKMRIKALHPHTDIRVLPQYFNGRSDHSHWKARNG